MHSVLTFEVAVGVVAFDFHRDGFDARFVSVLEVGDGAFVVVGFGIAHVHSHQHLCPVLALRSSGAGVDFEDAVHGVLLLSEHVSHLQFFECFDGFGVGFIDFLFGDHFFFVEVKS